VGFIVAGLLLYLTLLDFPITIWDPEVFAESPTTLALSRDQDLLVLPEPARFDRTSPAVAVAGTLLGGTILAASVVGLGLRRQGGAAKTHITRGPIIAAAIGLVVGLATLAGNNALTDALFNMNTTWLFLSAIAVASLTGVALGSIIEATMIRPLYERPIYQIMLTLGLGFITVEVVRSIWGRPEFTLPTAALFSGTGDGCPATTLADLIQYKCATVLLFDGRIRTYNEIFIILVGLVVLVGITLLIQRTRIGMIIRAGVQDSDMVEALGINVRRVFTFVFALGVGLASLGGILAAPSIGLSNAMGINFLLLALIALAIGGLTSFPGAAAGALLVGLMQQFMIKYGQIGINLPFLAEPFKPSPPLVPASVVLLMVVILLVLPQGLFGRSD
jgi:branched-chain amino acid transport system permease protein